MARTAKFDAAAGHKYFSAHCFNEAWDLIEKANRSVDENRRMVALNQASIYHWLQRPDCDSRRLSVGYWQASRIQVLLGRAKEAREHAETALAFSQGLQPFYVGYAHEALARAEALVGNSGEARVHLEAARAHAAEVKDKSERKRLLDDLASIGELLER